MYTNQKITGATGVKYLCSIYMVQLEIGAYTHMVRDIEFGQYIGPSNSDKDHKAYSKISYQWVHRTQLGEAGGEWQNLTRPLTSTAMSSSDYSFKLWLVELIKTKWEELHSGCIYFIWRYQDLKTGIQGKYVLRLLKWHRTLLLYNNPLLKGDSAPSQPCITWKTWKYINTL